MFTDQQILDWIERNKMAPHVGMNGQWHLTAHDGRECWGRGATFRECMTQVLTATGPDRPDAKNS